MTTIRYSWRPIEDLPEDWFDMVSPQLDILFQAWSAKRDEMGDWDVLQQFSEDLRQEWVEETMLLRNLYSSDTYKNELLLEESIKASLNLQPYTDVNELVDFITQDRSYFTNYQIKELHHFLTKDQQYAEAIDQWGNLVEIPLLHGQWKQSSNNPTRLDETIHEYCPPLHVDSEMETLVDLHRQHIEQNIPPEVAAAWLHHRFTQIHPFQDGNGRVARALASSIFIQAGGFPLIIFKQYKNEYISALEQADYGELYPLVHLFSTLQEKLCMKALSL
jgi:hypothetical protein